jgi:hypothetical protein
VGWEELVMKVIHEKCEKKVADDKKLPKSSYLVTYVAEEKLSYDIVLADSRVEIFDHYYDKYKEGLQSIGWTMGTMNPRTWNDVATPPEKKVKRKRK